MPKSGDIVRVRVLGRCYLAEVTASNRKVRLRFLSQVPSIGGRRWRELSFPAGAFEPHDAARVDFTLSA